MGVDEQTFLGLGIDDWIILGVSLLGVLAGYTRLIRVRHLGLWHALPPSWITVYWEPPGPELRWLEVLLALHLATIRLTFVGDN